MSDPEAPFIKEILFDPDAKEPRLIYADWLEELGDVRANYLRFEIQFAACEPILSTYDLTDDISTAENSLETRKSLLLFESLLQMFPEVDEDWLRQIGIKFDYVIFRFGSYKLDAIKIIKDVTKLSLMESKQLCESAPAVVLGNIPLFVAARLLDKNRDRGGNLIFGIQKSGLL